MKAVVLKDYLLEPLSNSFQNIDFVDTIEKGKDASFLIADSLWMKQEHLKQMPFLKWIQCARAGYEYADLAYIKQHDIVLTNAKGLYSCAIAEDIICKILMGVTNALPYLNQQKTNVFEPLHNRRELKGQCVGFLGTGSIAIETAKRLRAFGVHIIGYRKKKEAIVGFEQIYTEDELSVFMKQVDILVVTMALSDATWHILNKERLGMIKQGAMLVNVARGSIIDEKELLELLRCKQLAYAGLDVFEEEPLPSTSEFYALDNVYMTPHVAGITTSNRAHLCSFVMENVERFLGNRNLLNVVHE